VCSSDLSLAMSRLGRPLPGAPLLGALAALTGVVSLDALLGAITDRFAGQVAAGNSAAAVAAFDYVLAERGVLTGA
jgi:pyruvate ferredoxin oxidoreductase gamma subunit